MARARYCIRSGLLCHDVRLNTSIQIEVELDHEPTEKEAILLLSPLAEETVARYWCKDCNYDLFGIEITLVGT